MIKHLRDQYNASFSEEKYRQFVESLDRHFNFPVKFRIAETPVFIDRAFKQQLVKAADAIIDFLIKPEFKSLTENAIPQGLRVPNEDSHSLFLALDFAIVRDEHGELQPRLIEMQGFPSLFGWQDFLAGQYRENFPIPETLHSHFGLSPVEYQRLLTSVLLNGHNPEEVILLEIDPYNQNTAIDFVITKNLTGIEPVHIGDVRREGRKLYYLKDGRKKPIARIYNRVIFDELLNRNDLKLQFGFTEDVDVEWAGHPNWFFRISKYTMPFVRSEFIPECRFLSEYTDFPIDLENYVLKPLFSFSGSGIIFHVKQEDLDAIPKNNRHNYLLQRKVIYEPIIQAPDGMVKTEIRLLFFWKPNDIRPTLVTNSRG
ncbi:hypothetical protein QQ054_12245 [Oscillatoria amoena NRMC-F 0135]|nr:hypothetical protein [Oscillatoria amoena NRMC-F 0135]